MTFMSKYFAQLGATKTGRLVLPKSNSVISQMVDAAVFQLPADVSGMETFLAEPAKTSIAIDIIDSPENVATIKTLAAPFVTKITAAKANLLTIQSDVTTMSTAIHALADKLLGNDPMIARHLKLTGNTLTLEAMPWDNIKYFGSERAIVMGVNSDVATNASDSFSTSWWSMYCAKLPLVLKDSKEALIAVPLSAEVRDTAIKVLTASTKSAGLTEQDTAHALDIITAGSASSFRLMRMLFRTPHSEEMLNTAKENLELIRQMAPVMTVIKKGGLELSKTATEQIQNNLGIISKFMMASAYYISFLRRDTFAGAYILPNKMINPDVKADFSTVEGSESLIAHYLEYEKVSPRGVTVEQIVASKALLDDRYSKEITSVTTHIQARKLEAMTNATSAVFMDYAKAYATANNIMGIDTAIKNAQAHAMYNGIVAGKPLEDCIYKFIMALKYQGTLTEQLWSELNNAYTERLAKTAEFTEQDRNLVEAGVIAKAVSQFMVKTFVVVQK